MKLMRCFILFSLIILLILPGCGTKEYKEITLNEVTHSIFYTPQYVAINKGFFEEQGLKITLVNGAGADKVMTAVLSGQADIGFQALKPASMSTMKGRKTMRWYLHSLQKGTVPSLLQENRCLTLNGKT